MGRSGTGWPARGDHAKAGGENGECLSDEELAGEQIDLAVVFSAREENLVLEGTNKFLQISLSVLFYKETTQWQHSLSHFLICIWGMIAQS